MVDHESRLIIDPGPQELSQPFSREGFSQALHLDSKSPSPGL